MSLPFWTRGDLNAFFGLGNFTEAMSNVESAAAAGDKYNLRHVLLADGTGAIIGSALGSPFPPAV